MGRAKQKKPRSKRSLFIAALAAVLIAGLMGFMLVNANLLHVMKATVAIDRLPPAFEGAKLLYLSDIDLLGINTPARAGDAVKRLQALQPDILIIGGDFNSRGIMDILNNHTDVQTMLGLRGAFLQQIAEFDCSMGKFALTTSEDDALGDMTEALTANGFIPLKERQSRVTVGSDSLWLVGIGVDTDRVADIGQSFHGSDAVVCVAESPECFPRIVTAEASDSGPWADLCLAGRTHGGQINLLGHSILTLTSLEQQFLYGWTRETGTPMLTTSGLGCEGANLRWGSQAEVWLITLVRK